jgi:alanine racemase
VKISYKIAEIAEITKGSLNSGGNGTVQNIVYDTRRIFSGKDSLFVCLSSGQRDGHEFIQEAYEKGVRSFLVEKSILENFPEANFIKVENTLRALQLWAGFHRSKFNIPLVAITGSAGKTIVKEWLYSYLRKRFKVTRSPKSFNSQLGVAVSLFEINEQSEIALIETGISAPGEMEFLQEMIQPTHGILVSFGENHRHNFRNEAEHLENKLILFENIKLVYLNESFKSNPLINANFNFVSTQHYSDMNLTPFEEGNLSLVEAVARNFGLNEVEVLSSRIDLPKIALRLETLEGKNGQTIIIDAFNWTLDGLEQALGYQLAIADKRNRIVVFNTSDLKLIKSDELNKQLNQYNLLYKGEFDGNLSYYSTVKIETFTLAKDAVILYKGASSEVKRLALDNKLKKHTTFVEIDLGALSHNLKYWKELLPKQTQILAMVKAASYGVELGQIGQFLSKQNISYFGVAYVDEGGELRKFGVKTPILVMNSDDSSWSDCIEYELEPAIYSFPQLDSLVRELIHRDISNFPIHLKIDTGMHRLGFLKEETDELIAYLQSQPEIRVKSIFSHLADADNSAHNDYTESQIKSFDKWVAELSKALPYKFLTHLFNSEGSARFKNKTYDMVRLGIGMYGISSHADTKKKLRSVLSWKSRISQVKSIKAGKTIGYNCSYTAKEDMKIAVIPVGYADGFRRSLSNGVGQVYINNQACPVVGKVCMDMIMVDLGSLSPKAGDEVEIIGPNQSIEEMAEKCNTISYEIMTGLSRRMPRIFVQSED